MDGNKEEAERCILLSDHFKKNGDMLKALKFVEKAYRMNPTMDIKKKVDVLKNFNKSEQKNQGNSSTCYNEINQRNKKHNSKNINNTKHECDKANLKKNTNIHDKKVSEQELLCKKILSAKDYYELLDIKKNSDKTDIKKSYKKLALQLHPDKCKAPSSEEAFKKLSLAFQTLSDASKREVYDKYGEDGLINNVNDNFRYSRSNENGFLTPEDLFRMFFTGIHPDMQYQSNIRFNIHRTNSNRYTQNRTSNNSTFTSDQSFWNKIAGVVQIFPVIFMIFLALLGNFLPSYTPNQRNIFSLTKTREYNQLKATNINSVNYYINSNSNFDELYFTGSSKRNELEIKIEMTYFSRECSIEERIILQDIAFAKYYNDKNKLVEIQKRPKHSCEKLKWLKSNHPHLYRSISLGR